jgi:SAM-dependent methyltransferase
MSEKADNSRAKVAWRPAPDAPPAGPPAPPVENRVAPGQLAPPDAAIPLAAYPAPAPITVLNPARAVRAVQDAVDNLFYGRHKLWALEAGAGKRTRLDLPEDAYVVGVDRDEVALERNARLDEKVVADLSEYAPRAIGFDLITCWYVLEHVDDPAALLDRFAEWTARGGLVVVAVPHLRSLKSLVTKLTPHRFHVWVRRRVLGYPNAGKPGFGPYPTTLRRPIAPAAMVRRFAEHGYTPVFQIYFEDAKQARFRRQIRLTGRLWQLTQAVVRVASLGQLDAARSEYAVIFRRDRP